jgi:hypothetical protein
MPQTALADPATMWRTKLRTTIEGIDHGKQVAHCLDRNLIGIGWGIENLPAGSSLDEVCNWIAKNNADGWGPAAAATVRRFGEGAQVGEFVWTRDTAGRYLLCKITGAYRYDVSPPAWEVDVHQVRDVQWAPTPLNDLDVPGAVIRAFVGTGLSFSRIWDESARLLTPYLWEKLHGRPLPALNITPSQVLTSHLDPYDVEDLVYVWLQVARNYLALPRSRQRDTPAYEWTMIHRGSGRRGIVQVKTGSEPVDLAKLAAAKVGNTATYAFATCGIYGGDHGLVDEVIHGDELLSFASEHPGLLPPRVRSWVELAARPE